VGLPQSAHGATRFPKTRSGVVSPNPISKKTRPTRHSQSLPLRGAFAGRHSCLVFSSSGLQVREIQVYAVNETPPSPRCPSNLLSRGPTPLPRRLRLIPDAPPMSVMVMSVMVMPSTLESVSGKRGAGQCAFRRGQGRGGDGRQQPGLIDYLTWRHASSARILAPLRLPITVTGQHQLPNRKHCFSHFIGCRFAAARGVHRVVVRIALLSTFDPSATDAAPSKPSLPTAPPRLTSTF
jgi:hypothetical protein